MDKILNSWINTTFGNYHSFVYLAVIGLSGLAILFINYRRINRYLLILLLLIGISSFAFILIDSATINISRGRYSIQPLTCEKTARFDQFIIEIKSCNKSNRYVSFGLLITNIGKDRKFQLYTKNTRIFDFSGNDNYAQTVSIGNSSKDWHSSGTVIPSNNLIKASINFERVLLEGDILSLLEINTSHAIVQFHNVRLLTKEDFQPQEERTQ